MASEDWPFTNAWSLHGNREIVSRYEILERIGEGTFGEVHRARRRDDNLIVALKEIHDFASSEREIKALLALDHPNVVKLHEYFTQGSNMVLVLEYLPHNLSEVIRSGKGELSDAEVKGWMIQIFRGLAACHAVSILHRDLKPNNLLIAEDRTLKIADFGQARILSVVDFENEEGLSGSEIHKNYGTGSDSQGVHDAPAMSDNQELEFQADVPVAEGRTGDDTSTRGGGMLSGTGKVDACSGCFGEGIGQSMDQGNLSKAPVESIPLARDCSGVLRDSDNFEGNGSHLGSGPTNVGISALADAVKDARNYFTVEEMVRSGTGLGLSGLQRQQIIASQPTEDLVCCGWFPMENVEKHPALVEGRNSASGNASTGKDNVVSVERDQSRELEDDFSTLSDAEGTRWYGAPEFQYSYMDSKIAGPAVGKRIDETYGHAIGSEEEWEKEGSEVGTYQNSSARSQESTGRGNSESEHGSDFTTMVGTRWYKAPELLYGATKYGMGIDIWAVGCIFGELLWGKPLFPGLNDIDQLSRLVRILGSPNEKIWAGVSLLPDFNKICFVDDRSPLTLRKYLPDISDAALEFLQKVLTYDPVLRLTAERALEDEFFLKPPLPCPCHELQLPVWDESEDSDEEWGDWKDPGSPFSDFEILG